MVDEAGPDLSTIEGRVAAVCEWFDLPRPVLAYDPDELDAVLLTDDFMEWWRTSAVSLDWLACGEPVSDDPRAMVTAMRRKRLEERQFIQTLSRLDGEEVRLLGDAMARTVHGGVPLEECKRAMEAHRAARMAA